LHTVGSRKQWLDHVRKAEDLGYSTIFLPDHFGDQLAPIPALMSAAEISNLRVGMLVLDNDYRHPVVLAKEAATMDLLSEGRLELGIGAGWMRSDYEQSGMPYDPPKVRVERFEEGVKVLKGLFAEGPFSFQGKHYTITGLDGKPDPVQDPHPPLLIGGGGPRVLRFAGAEADIVGINVNLRAGEVRPEMGADATRDAILQKVAWVREGAGDRFDDLELNVLVMMCFVTDDRMGQAEMFGSMFGLNAEQALEVPLAVCGTVDEICDDLTKRRELYGISYPVLNEASFEPFAPVVERMAGR
jgi:probable F420-dependent oxidoreductase